GVGNGDGRWSWRIALDRLDNRSQPMQYVIARQVPADDPPRVAEGAVADRNPDGSPRLVIGRGGLDDSRQQLAKLALGFAPRASPSPPGATRAVRAPKACCATRPASPCMAEPSHSADRRFASPMARSRRAARARSIAWSDSISTLGSGPDGTGAQARAAMHSR